MHWRKCRNWQTSKTKDLVTAMSCGFKSHLPHDVAVAANQRFLSRNQRFAAILSASGGARFLRVQVVNGLPVKVWFGVIASELHSKHPVLLGDRLC